MADIDGAYWRKCIGHLRKEIHFYMMHDGLIPKDTVQAPSLPISEPEMSTDDELFISVSFFPLLNFIQYVDKA